MINVEARLHSPKKISFVSIVGHTSRNGSDMIGKVVGNISDDTFIPWEEGGVSLQIWHCTYRYVQQQG